MIGVFAGMDCSFEGKNMSTVPILVFRKGLVIAYATDPDIVPAGWTYSRTIQCAEQPVHQGSEAKKLIAGLARDGFYVPSALL